MSTILVAVAAPRRRYIFRQAASSGLNPGGEHFWFPSTL